ncbi:hypothetical protein [Nocardioides sp. zg-1228]|uniref:hypothetical protein n=1 Tax=Nocardioides sp. zg-1228 TaxID=2763008 RepID=UPI001642B9F6|nr:hypothetical protein [Nocardioides sp. zg-1228]MBC2931488.1 hypothetical protein [Nocardioides sp. zg-1228]QSF57094.1 hypothetical protein JX575_16210 [Nocardioides sp. zg-1228]
MIISGHLHHHHRPKPSADSSRLAARVAEIDARRRDAELSVDRLVVAWQGGAALHRGSHWDRWDTAAHDTIDALGALLGALDLARRELADIDRGPVVPRQADRRVGH